MPRVLPAGAGVAVVFCALQLVAAAQSTVPGQSTTPGVSDAGGLPAPTPALERGRAVYVLNHCHFCHGTDLRRAVMGASDLLRSPLIGADQDGELLGAVVRAGRPNLQTAMPRYDFTPTELTELARYIHYLRQTGRYADLTAEPREGGNSVAGESYFSRRCASCHSVDGDLKGLASKYEAAALRARVLRPPAFAAIEGTVNAGRRAHLQLLEQHSDMDFANLLVYLEMATR